MSELRDSSTGGFSPTCHFRSPVQSHLRLAPPSAWSVLNYFVFLFTMVYSRFFSSLPLSPLQPINKCKLLFPDSQPLIPFIHITIIHKPITHHTQLSHTCLFFFSFSLSQSKITTDNSDFINGLCGPMDTEHWTIEHFPRRIPATRVEG